MSHVTISRHVPVRASADGTCINNTAASSISFKSHTLREALTKGFGGTRAQKRSGAALRGCIYEKLSYVTPALGPLRKGQFCPRRPQSIYGLGSAPFLSDCLWKGNQVCFNCGTPLKKGQMVWRTKTDILKFLAKQNVGGKTINHRYSMVYIDLHLPLN
ncbi:hypothetical protein C8R45DRAFT_1134715 [Mycena sanguinolenta]|nr:hypothetical protein C8R45DRAFT_1134715 [Mycena sanguinolenta]